MYYNVLEYFAAVCIVCIVRGIDTWYGVRSQHITVPNVPSNWICSPYITVYTLYTIYCLVTYVTTWYIAFN